MKQQILWFIVIQTLRFIVNPALSAIQAEEVKL